MKAMGDTVIIKNARFENMNKGIYMANLGPYGSGITITNRPMEITGTTFINCIDGIRKDDSMYNTTLAGYPGGKYSFNDKPLLISCNGFQNLTRGIALFGNTSKMYLATTVGVMANKFTNVTNPIYSQNLYSPLTWTYNDALDGGTTGFVFGPGSSSATVTITGTPVISVCGTSNPGARKSYEEVSFKTDNEIIVYPNPFDEIFNVVMNEDIGNSYKIELQDALGNYLGVWSGNLERMQQIILCPKILPPSIYILQITVGNTRLVKKLIKN